MNKTKQLWATLALSALAALPVSTGFAVNKATLTPGNSLKVSALNPKTDSVIVLYSARNYKAKSSTEFSKKLTNGTVNLQRVSQIGSGDSAKTMEVWTLPVSVDSKEFGGWAQELKRVLGPNVQAIELNSRFKKHAVPTITDPGFSAQWHLTPSLPTVTLGSTDVAKIWDVIATRGQNTVVAVIDDGIVPHKDLVASRVLPGRGFIRNPLAGDTDPTSPLNPGLQCGGPTVWHGLSMSLLVGADINGKGTVGAAPLANILPVRALDECGGSLADIVDAITWSAGGTVPGAPVNSFPADVINMSLGNCNEATGTCPVCPASLQAAIDFAVSKGSIPVASAGNESFDNRIGSPANCNGVISVQGHNEDGSRSVFSNTSATASISAPAGGPYGSSSYSGIVTGSNAGGQTSTGPGADIDVISGVGTSQASAITSGVIAVAKSLNKTLDSATIASLLNKTAKDYPADSFCAANPSQCAKGLLDANAFLSQVAATTGLHFADNPHSIGRTKVGGTGSITTEVTSLTGKALTYTWSSDQGISFTGQGTPSITYTVPASASFSAPVDLVFRVTVKDSDGNTFATFYQVDLFKSALTVQDASFSVGAQSQPVALDLPITAEAGIASIDLVGAPAGLSIDASKRLALQNVAVGSYSFSYVVTDNDGQVAPSRGISLTISAAPVVQPPAPSGGGGGGGALTLFGLLVQAGLLLTFRSLHAKKD